MTRKKEMEKRIRLKYNHSLNGKIQRMYSSLVRRAKLNNRMVDFDKDWFVKFAVQSKELKKLYQEWVSSDFLRKLTPSVDRIDNCKGYLKTNIRFISQSDNSKRGRKITYKEAQKIRIYYKTGFYTQCQLARMYCLNQGYISKILNNRLYVTNQ